MMNMQKILHSYKHWQDYNKQFDIGLMTLYQNQELKKQDQMASYFQGQKGRPEEAGDGDLHYEVEAELLGREYDGRYHSLMEGEGKRKGKEGKDVKEVPLRGKKYRRSNPFAARGKDSPSGQERKGIKVGYYDVTHLSNLHSHRAVNELPLLQRVTKFQRQSLTLPSEKMLPDLKIDRGRRFSEMDNSPKKLKMKTDSVLKGGNGSPSEVYDKLFKHQTKTQREVQPITFSDYKLISFCKYKQRERANDCKTTFNNPSPDIQPSFRLKRIRNDPNFKLKPQSKTLMSSRMMQEGGLRDAISIYFNPVVGQPKSL